MQEYIKNNKISLILVVFTFLLGGVAIGTALKLYQLRTTTPTNTGATAQNTIEACQVLVIPLSTSTPTPSPSGSATPTPSSTSSSTPTQSSTATPTPSSTASSTPTPSATATPTANPQACDVSCNTDSECRDIDANYICYSATRTCRHINYPQENDCEAPPTSTASPTPTPSTATSSTPKASSTSTPTSVSSSGASATPTLVAQSSATPTPDTLPEAGISLPTILGVSIAGILMLGAIILAL